MDIPTAYVDARQTICSPSIKYGVSIQDGKV